MEVWHFVILGCHSAVLKTFPATISWFSTEPADSARKHTFEASGYNMLRAIRMEKGWSKIQIHWLSGSLHAPPHAASTVSPIRAMTFSHLSFNFLGFVGVFQSFEPRVDDQSMQQLSIEKSIQVTWGFVTGFPLTLNTRSPSNKMPSHPPPSQGTGFPTLEIQKQRQSSVVVYIYTYISILCHVM